MKIKLAPALGYHQIGQRANQEDALYPAGPHIKDGVSTDYIIVCDGVGGADKGEVASATVSAALGDIMSQHTDVMTPEIFSKAMVSVYDTLEKEMDRNGYHDMATTLTFVRFDTDGAFAAHIGDSRIYHIRPGKGILYRSEDHSLVNAMVKAGLITEAQAETHPQRNVITRCVGHVQEDADLPRATTRRITDIAPGDWFLACSDGVLHCVSDEKFVEILSDTTTTDAEKRDTLAKMSNDSTDNNTLYMLRVEDIDELPNDISEGVDFEIEIPLRNISTPKKPQHSSSFKNLLHKIFKG